MSTYRKLMTFGCAAVLALGLAACGGGGDDDTAEAPTVTEPTGPSQEDLDDANQRADDAEDALAAEQAAARAAELRQLSRALTNFMAATPTRVDATIGYNPGTGRFTVSPDQEDDGTPDTLTPRFSAAADGAVMAGMWTGQTQTRRVTGAESDTLVFYTDQGLRNGLPLDRLLGATRFPETALQVALDNATDDTPRIRGDDFAKSGSKSHIAPGTTVSATRPVMVSGTYAGVMGTYLCSAGTCTSAPAAAGAGVTLTGTWHFQPDDRNALTEPADHRYFGWWLRENATGTMVVGTFAGSTGAADTTDYSALNGSATYSGAAAGQVTLAPSLGQIEGGDFTADASLSANFSLNRISGMIDNFMVDGEATDWSVTLRSATIEANNAAFAANATAGTTADTVWSIGGTAARPGGSWQGQFHDGAPPTAPDSGTPRQVTGQFQATYGGAGQMIGAYGAHKE